MHKSGRTTKGCLKSVGLGKPETMARSLETPEMPRSLAKITAFFPSDNMIHGIEDLMTRFLVKIIGDAVFLIANGRMTTGSSILGSPRRHPARALRTGAEHRRGRSAAPLR